MATTGEERDSTGPATARATGAVEPFAETEAEVGAVDVAAADGVDDKMIGGPGTRLHGSRAYRTY